MSGSAIVPYDKQRAPWVLRAALRAMGASLQMADNEWSCDNPAVSAIVAE